MASAPSFLARLASAYMERERQRVGIPQQEQAAAESETAQLMRRVQAARIAQQMGMAPAEHDAELKLRGAQTESATAQAEAARAMAAQRTNTPAKAVERTVDLGDRVEYVYTDGTRETKSKGAVPKAPEAGGGDDAFASNPFLTLDKTTGEQRLAVRLKGGGLKWVDEIEGTPVAPGPTADMRNVEFQAQAVEPAFELVQKSLDSLKQASEGWTGSVAGMIPGTQAHYAKTRFQDQAKALLGAIVARQAGEGSRLSDEDRKAYSQASTLVNNLILLPGGIEEAQARLNDARALLDTVMQRRRGGGVAPPADGSGGAGGTLDPAVQKILDMIRERRNAGQ